MPAEWFGPTSAQHSTPVALKHYYQRAGPSIRPRASRQCAGMIPQRAASDAGLHAPGAGIAAIARRHEAVRLPAEVALLSSACLGRAWPLTEESYEGHDAEGERGKQQDVGFASHVSAQSQTEARPASGSSVAETSMTPSGHGYACVTNALTVMMLRLARAEVNNSQSPSAPPGVSQPSKGHTVLMGRLPPLAAALQDTCRLPRLRHRTVRLPGWHKCLQHRTLAPFADNA